MTPADGGGDGPAVRPGRHKAMGVDLGERRIGVAVSDSGGALAFPLCVIDRAGDPAADHRRLADMVAEHEVVTVVVGLPLSLDGSRGPAAASAIAEAARSVGIAAQEAPSIEAALRAIASDRIGGRVLICGSLHFAGVVLRNNA